MVQKQNIGIIMEPATVEEYHTWLKDRSKQKRAQNRASSVSELDSKGYKYSSHNNGAHLIVACQNVEIDFWPGTGLWKVRGGNKSGRGLFNLCKYIDSRSQVS